MVVGMGEVIDGWDMGLMTMHLGEKCDLFITSKYAFGDEGRPPLIPAKAPVIFRVELLQIGDRKCERLARKKRSDSSLLQEANMQKNEGNNSFKKHNYSDAAEFYRDALSVLECIDKVTDEINDLKVSLNQNLAMCLNNTEDYKEALFHC